MLDLWIMITDSLALNQINQFHFLRPWWLLFAPISGFLYWLINKEVDGISQWQSKMSPSILKHLTIKGNTQNLFSPRKFFLPFLLLSTLVLAGPSWQQQASPFLEDKSVLIIALDLSSSMQADDLKPSRLVRAKQKINELMELRGDANTALIAFAGSAHTAMPVTKDRQMIRHFLEVLEGQIMPVKSKDPLQLLPKMEALLNRVDTPATILLMTDSIDGSVTDAYQAFFAATKHQLVIWSISNPAVTDNQPAIDELEQLAKSSDGQLVTFSLTGDDIKTVNHYIKTHMVAAPDSALPWHDAGYLILFLVAAIQLMWFRKGWTLKW